MNSADAMLDRPAPVTSPGPSRTAPTTFAAVGAGATATLALVTSGVRLPAAAVIAASLIAMGVVIGAWLLIGRSATTPRRLYAVAAAWGAPLLFARPLFSGDVWSYLAQGETAARGLDPYRLGPLAALGPDSVFTAHVSHYWQETPAPYGPAWVLLSRAVALLTGENLTAGVLAYRLIAVAGIVLIAWSLPRLAARAGVAPELAIRLGVLNPLILWHLLAGVHNDALMLGLMLAGLELALAGVDRMGAGGSRTEAGPAQPPLAAGAGPVLPRLAAGVTLLTLAAGIKFVAGAALCVVVIALLQRPGRSIQPVIAVTAGALAGMAALSAATGLGWLTSPLGSLSVYSWMAPTTATGMLVGAVAGGGTTSTAVFVANAVGLAVCVPVVILLLVAMLRRRLPLIHGLGLIFTVALLCGAVVQPWYVLWAVLPLAAAARTHRQRVTLTAVSAIFALAVPPFVGDVTAMIAGYTTAVLTLAVAALLLRRRFVRTPAVAGPRAEVLTPQARPGTAAIPRPRRAEATGSVRARAGAVVR